MARARGGASHLRKATGLPTRAQNGHESVGTEQETRSPPSSQNVHERGWHVMCCTSALYNMPLHYCTKHSRPPDHACAVLLRAAKTIGFSPLRRAPCRGAGAATSAAPRTPITAPSAANGPLPQSPHRHPPHFGGGRRRVPWPCRSKDLSSRSCNEVKGEKGAGGREESEKPDSHLEPKWQ